MELIHLAYMSRIAFQITDEAILDLLVSSRKKNHDNNITSALIYGSGVFLHMLEGERKNIMDLYATIQNDERHEKVILLFEEQLDERQFKHWAMRFIPLSETRLDRILEFGQFIQNYEQHNKVNLTSPVICELKSFSAEDF